MRLLDLNEVVVINLDRREDRWERFLTRWEATGLMIPVRRFSAVDGHLTNPPEHFRGSRVARRGEWGCRASHMGVLDSLTGPTLVLEDDAFLSPRLLELSTLRSPEDLDVLFLGGTSPQLRPDGPPIQRIHAIVRTHAYIVANHTTVQASMPRWSRFGIEVMFAEAAMNKYLMNPSLAVQDGASSDIGAA